MGNIKIAPIIRQLQGMGFNVKETLISYKSALENAYIYIGKEPLPEDATISVNELEQPNNRLTLRCKPTTSSSMAKNDNNNFNPEIKHEATGFHHPGMVS